MAITAIRTESFSASFERKGEAVIVWMTGNADMAVHEQVKTFLDELAGAVRPGRVGRVVFELAELYFMNSSCLSLLLRFLNGILECRPDARYKVLFRSNKNLRWQIKSLAALREYASELVVVE